MTHLVGTKGQVVIPKAMRDALQIQPGDRVDFVLDGGAVRIELVRPRTARAGLLAGASLVRQLEDDRRHEER